MTNKKEKKPTFQEELLRQQSDLEAEMAIDQVTEDEAKADTEEQKTDDQKSLIELIEEEGGPSSEIIEQWKQDFLGKVYFVYFGKDDFIIYRYCAQPEWKSLLKEVRAAKVPEGDKEDLLDDRLYNKCVLYPDPTPQGKATLGAGTVSTVAMQIKVSSNFLPDDVALGLIRRL